MITMTQVHTTLLSNTTR